MRLTRVRKKSIKVPLILPISIIISGGFIALSFGSNSKPKQLYPTVMSAQSVSIFSKLLNSSSNTESVQQNSILNDSKFTELIDKTKIYKGSYSVYVKDLNNNKKYVLNENKQIFAASLYKIPTAISVLKLIENKKLKLTDTIVYTQSDYEGGTGILNNNAFGTNFTVEQLLLQLLKNSDNVAQNMLVRKIGHDILYKTMQQLTPKIKPDDYIYNNISSTNQIGLMLENSIKLNYLSSESKKYLYDLMFETSFDDRISPYIKSPLKFSHKIGSWPTTNSWHDCGIVFNEYYQANYVVCLMTEKVDYNEFLDISKLLGEFISSAK